MRDYCIDLNWDARGLKPPGFRADYVTFLMMSIIPKVPSRILMMPLTVKNAMLILPVFGSRTSMCSMISSKVTMPMPMEKTTSSIGVLFQNRYKHSRQITCKTRLIHRDF